MRFITSRRLALIATIVLVAIGFTADTPHAAQLTPTAQPAGFFPVGVWYSGGKARAPMLERIDATSEQRWGKDLDQIKSLGFNTVKTWVDWATAEPQPGQYRFENLDLLLKLAQQRGLHVVVQIYLDSAPDWVGKRYPDGKFVDRSGAIIESQSAPGFCIDHPGVRKEIVGFLSELSRRANQFTALYAWDVWSEPHVINWAEFPYLTNPEFCFCPNSQRRFREWLKQKYVTIDAINAAWYRHFENWEQVEPPRGSTILSYTDYLDWRAFIDDKLAGDLRTRVDAIRSADRQHPITSHAASPGMFGSPTDGYGNPDDFKMAANADYYGTSIYPRHSQSTRPWPYQMLSAGLDFERSAGRSFGKGFWIGELQAGQGITGMRIADPVRGADETYWMWKVVSHGARQIAIYAYYPMSSGFESGGYGLINLDGTLTPRSQDAGKTAQIIAREGRELLEAKPAPAQVAVLYNRLSYMVGGSQPSLSRLGNATRDSLMGLHRAFFEQQIPIDFIGPQDLIENRAAQYKIIFLPFPVMMSKDVADAVTRYIQNGGTVVAEARLAWNDERGFASDRIPGFNLAEVFGVREKEIRPVDRPVLVIPVDPEMATRKPDYVEDIAGVHEGSSFGAEAFEEDLEPAPGTKVILRWKDNNEVAGTSHRFGKGRAILIGSFIALAYQRHPDENLNGNYLVRALAKSAGVMPEVEVSGSGTNEVEVRRMLAGVRPRGEYVFVFNHATTAADAKIAIANGWRTAYATDVVSGDPVDVGAGNPRKMIPQTTNGKIVLSKSLAGGEVWVVRLHESTE
jgi:beta-galactosidase